MIALLQVQCLETPQLPECAACTGCYSLASLVELPHSQLANWNSGPSDAETRGQHTQSPSFASDAHVWFQRELIFSDLVAVAAVGADGLWSKSHPEPTVLTPSSSVLSLICPGADPMANANACYRKFNQGRKSLLSTACR